MTDKLEATLDHLDGLVREEVSCNDMGKKAFVALSTAARQLGEDPNERGASFFRTFGKVNLFPYDEGRNINGHGVGYRLDSEGRIVVFVGDSVPRSEEEFMQSFTRNSSDYLDRGQREEFLGAISEAEILKRLGGYSPG